MKLSDFDISYSEDFLNEINTYYVKNTIGQIAIRQYLKNEKWQTPVYKEQ